MKNISKFSWLVIGLWVIFFISFGSPEVLKENYFVSITMAIGSFIAGATSEGGGAVAFPVLTLLFKIQPAVARDFSLLIQSFGMTAASLTIIKKKITIEKQTLLYASLGAVIGNVLGFSFFTQLFNPQALKLFFCSLWLAFAFVLIKIKIYGTPLRSTQVTQNKKSQVNLISIGVLGGILNSITGSGLDIFTFSLLTLFYNIDEKIATPTSVVLMALNSILCVALKLLFFGGVAEQALNFLQVSLPIVVIGAPLGSLFISQRSRSFITKLLVCIIIIQFITALIIIPLNTNLIFLISFTFFISLLFFYSLRSKQS